MVLHVEDVVVTQLVGKLDLRQRLLDDSPFVIRVPLLLVGGPRKLQFVKEPELHRRSHLICPGYRSCSPRIGLSANSMRPSSSRPTPIALQPAASSRPPGVPLACRKTNPPPAKQRSPAGTVAPAQRRAPPPRPPGSKPHAASRRAPAASRQAPQAPGPLVLASSAVSANPPRRHPRYGVVAA